MVKKIRLTSLAEADLETITDYLADNWSSSVVSKFLIQFEGLCITISNCPEIFPVISKNKNVRKAVLTKHN